MELLRMNRRFSQYLTASLTSALVLGAASTAMAHPGHGEHSLADGFTHPLFGLDHLLAMVALGLLAVRMGGRARWAMPATFMVSMLAGGLLSVAGVQLPVV